MSHKSGALPLGWTEAALDELGEWVGGGTPSKSTPAYWEGGDIPWVSPKDMGEARLSGTRDRITACALTETSARLFAAGSVAFVVRSGILARTLPIALVPFEATANQDIRVLVPHRGVNPEWLLWALNASAEEIRDSCRKDGTTVASIDSTRLKNYRVPVPPRAEQDRIVAALSSQLSSVRAGVTDLHAASAQIPRYSDAVQVAAVSGRLAPNDYEDASGGAILDEAVRRRRERWAREGLGRYADPAPPGKPGDVTLPAGWVRATVDQLAIGVQYGTSAKASALGEGVPVLRMGNIVNGKLDLSEVKYLPPEHPELPALLLRDGDVLFNRTNSPELVGKAAVARGLPNPCSFASYLIRVRTAPELEPEFLVHYLNSAFGREWARQNVTQQVGQANINGSKLRALTIPLPPLSVQRRICREVDRLSSARTALSGSLDTAEAQADSLTQALLRDAFSGHLVSQDPSDEPASELLNRIKTERVAQEAGSRPNRSSRPSRGPKTQSQVRVEA